MKKNDRKEKNLEKINDVINHDDSKTIFEMKDMIQGIQIDIKNLIENFNEEYLNIMYLNLKNEFIRSMNSHMIGTLDPELERRMVKDCDMKETCKDIFKKYLKKHTTDLNPDNLTLENINKSKTELDSLKKKIEKEDCKICFDEVSSMFKNQMNLIKSFKIYDSQKDEDQKKIAEIDEKKIVADVLDPISHEKRLKILKAVAFEPHSFSSLSNLTNLKGGNLIFHINKLINNDLIFQKQNHGEYILTTKGFKTIQIVLNME
ncbi:MAG: winged helix-turn-helix transcriptional regulator [Methanobrevibacter sp. CfCl-M3]